MPGLWRWRYTEGLEDEGKDLCHGGSVKPVFIVIENI
jgi:hypothetical protein